MPSDAAAMAALFRAAKFDAIEAKANLGNAELRRVLREFSRQAAGADVAVLFFAGHGIEVDRTNYLIPVDARLAADLDVEDEAVSLDRVLQLLEPAKRLRLVILDACRDNSFAAGMKRTGATRSIGRGLARIEPGVSNTLIAYATKANAVAEDGKGANSPYTSALVKHLTVPGLDLRIALRHVRDDVLAATGNKQEPYFTGSLGSGTLSLLGPVQPSGQPQLSAAAVEWARVDKSSAAELETFAGRHPASAEAEYARARLGELSKVAVVTPPPPPVVALPKPVEPTVGVFTPGLGVTPVTPERERALKRGDTFKECDVCPEMVVVPAGSFMMGSPPGEKGRGRNESPHHQVSIARPFAVGKFEVTFAEWDACVTAGGCKYKPDDRGWGRGRRPVINVSWIDITYYQSWLSQKTGKTYRLLTEAEWEYAARAGTTTRYAFGDTITKRQAQYVGGETVQYVAGETVDVGSFPANRFGLHDMHGNVSEWAQDCRGALDYSGAPADGSAFTTGDCLVRPLRGGSWISGPQELRSASRYHETGFTRRDRIGFRLARTLAP